MTERAVSEVISYVLIFSLIVATIGIVSAVGFAGLESQQEAEQVNNVERAFDVFDHNMQDIHQRGAPSRATEMRLGGGTLGYGDETTIDVEIGGENVTVNTQPLVYSQGNSEIVYVAGATMRSDDGNAIMLNEPGFVLENERVVVPLIDVNPRAGNPGRSISGDITVRVNSRRGSINGTVPDSFSDPSDDINITVTSTRSEAWERYFESQPGEIDPLPENENEVRLTIGGSNKESVSVTRMTISIGFER